MVDIDFHKVGDIIIFKYVRVSFLLALTEYLLTFLPKGVFALIYYMPPPNNP